MKLLIASLFAFSSAAFAANIVPVSYHEGTLVSFSVPASGSNCAVSSEQSCSDVYRTQYMVTSEGILYALTPVSSATGSIAERATLGWSKAFSKSSSLYHQELGTPPSFEMMADISSSRWVIGSRSTRPLRHDNN